MLTNIIVVVPIVGITHNWVAEHGAVEPNLVSTTTEWLCEEHACAVVLQGKPRVAGLHFFDAIAVGECFAYLCERIDTEAATFAPTMPTMANLLAPSHMPVYVADVALMRPMMHKNPLDGGVGMGMMRKKQYTRGVTVKPMGWV